MSGSTELHRLIVRLTGDGRAFQVMMDNALDATYEYAAQVKKLGATTQQYQGLINQAAKVTQQATLAVAGYQDRLTKLQQRYESGMMSLDDYNEKKADLRRAMISTAASIAAYNTELERQVAVTQKAAKADASAAAKKMAEAEREKNREIKEGQRLTQAMLTPLERYEARLRHLEGLLQRARISQDTYNRAVRQAQQAFEKAQPAATNWAKVLKDQVGSSVKNFGMSWSMYITAPLTALGFVIGRAGLQMDTMRRGMMAVTGSAEETAYQLERLRIVAKLPGLSFKEAVEGSIALQAAGFTARKAERALKSFGNALATVGKGQAELHMVNRALTQIAGKGKIMAQEVNQIAEHLPQIRTMMNEAFKTSNSEEISKMGVTAEVFLEKIIQEAEKLLPVTKGIRIDLENMAQALFISFSKVGEVINEIASPALQTATGWVEKAGQTFSRMHPAVQKTIVIVASITAVIGPLLVVTGSLVIALGQAATAYQVLTGVTFTATIAKYGFTSAVIAAKVALVAATAALVAYSTYLLLFKKQHQDIDESLENSGKMATKFAEKYIQGTDAILQASKSMANPEANKFLKENLEVAAKDVEALKVRVEEARQTWESYYDTLFGGVSVHGHLSGEEKIAAANLQEMEARLAEADERYQKLFQTIENMPKDVGLDPELLEKGREFIESLKLQVETFGMSSRQAQIYEMELKKLPPAMIATMRAQDSVLTRMEADKKAQEESAEAVRNYRAELEKQIATVGMTENQVKLWELAEKKIPPVILEQIKALQLRNEKLQLGDDVKKYQEELEKQARQAGLTADQVKRLELAERGATDAMLKGADAALRRKETAEAQAEADKLVQSLREQIATIGFTTEQTELWKLSQRGVSQETLKLIAALTEQKRIMDEGAKLMEKHKTPLQKYIEQYTDLRKMLSAGSINADVFKKELELINQEFIEAQEKADVKVRFSVEGLGAVRAGSEEFMKILAETQQRKDVKAAEAQLGGLRHNIDRQLAQGRNPLGGPPVVAGAKPGVVPKLAGKVGPGMPAAGGDGKTEIGLLSKAVDLLEAIASREDILLQPISFAGGE